MEDQETLNLWVDKIRRKFDVWHCFGKICETMRIVSRLLIDFFFRFALLFHKIGQVRLNFHFYICYHSKWFSIMICSHNFYSQLFLPLTQNLFLCKSYFDRVISKLFVIHLKWSSLATYSFRFFHRFLLLTRCSFLWREVWSSRIEIKFSFLCLLSFEVIFSRNFDLEFFFYESYFDRIILKLTFLLYCYHSKSRLSIDFFL